MKRSAVVAIVCTCAAFVAPALAQQPAVAPQDAIVFLDKNGDGRVDVREYAEFQLTKLAQFDADNDGKLQQAEFAASLAPSEAKGAPQIFPVFDADKDGGLNAKELIAYHGYVFMNFVDKDRDGAMSAEELADATAASGNAPAPTPASPSPLAMLDHNKDGKTDLNEYLNFQLPNLARFDANGNGRLSRSEFKDSLPEKAKLNAARTFQAFDLNKDRSLSQDEFLGYHAWVFKNLLDGNRDGFIDIAEWAAFRSTS